MNKPLPPGRHVVLGPLEPLDEVVTVDEMGMVVEIEKEWTCKEFWDAFDAYQAQIQGRVRVEETLAALHQDVPLPSGEAVRSKGDEMQTTVKALPLVKMLRDQRDECADALRACVRVAKSWHGDVAWDIYYNHSPEMKPIRDALAKVPTYEQRLKNILAGLSCEE